ncbi:MAG: hypothetical protein CMJ28_01875 [Phycisphaerae bacterium]|nr:hypothetical protein [Phycisphaerae bacterium]
MRPNKSLVPLAAITAFLLLAVFTRSGENNHIDLDLGVLMIPDLKSSVDTIDSIVIRKGGDGMNLRREGDLWRCESADGYPVRNERVRRFLMQLSQLEQREAKTSDPARHHAMNLALPDPDGNTTEVELLSGANTLFHLLLGKQQWQPKATFARLAQKDQTYKCKGHIDFDINPVSWMQTTFCELQSGSIRKVQMGRMTLVPSSDSLGATPNVWALKTDGGEPISEAIQNSARTSLPAWPVRLDFDSVRSRTEHPLSPESAVLRFETIEGQLEVSLDLGDTADTGAWCTIDFNPGLGQKPQAAWSQWSKWSFHLPDWRVSAVREIWEGLKGP